MMGSEVSDTDPRAVYATREAILHTAMIRAAIHAARGLESPICLEWIDADKSDDEGGSND